MMVTRDSKQENSISEKAKQCKQSVSSIACRLLLNVLPLKIVIHRQRDSFVLMADDASRDCRVCITAAQL